VHLTPCQRADHDTPCPACSEPRLRTDHLEDLFHSLRELVDAMAVRRDTYAVIESDQEYRYAQVLADRDGALLVEASSTEATDDGTASAALTPAEEVELLRLCYDPPDDRSPNWHRVFPDPWPWPAPVVAELLVRTLCVVLGATPDELRVRVEHAQPGLSVVRP
jgi:hypothetical protein